LLGAAPHTGSRGSLPADAASAGGVSPWGEASAPWINELVQDAVERQNSSIGPFDLIPGLGTKIAQKLMTIDGRHAWIGPIGSECAT